MNRIHLYGLSLALALCGLTLFIYKAFYLHFPLSPDLTSSAWTIETSISFTARNEPVKVELFIPKNTARVAVMDENFISRGFGLTNETDETNRKAIWSIRKASGDHTLYYRATLRKLGSKKKLVTNKSPIIDAVPFEGPEHLAAKALIEEIRARSADTLSLCTELFKQLNRPRYEQHVALLLGKKSSPLKKSQLAVRVLAQADIPARIAHGVRLVDSARQASVMHWVEIYDQKSWLAFDTQTGLQLNEDEYVTWWRGDQGIYNVMGATRVQVKIALSENQEEAINTAIAESQATLPAIFQVSLFNLPLESQSVYRVLLLVPIGALLMVILRNLVGITTFGTFMPILVALAFRETGLLWGLTLFITVVSIGLLIRFYLEQLKLLLVPRLAAVLTIVILLMVTLSFITHKADIARGLSVALFPMVILTMTIERMSIVWEERGALYALKQGIGSLTVASLTYLVMSLDFLSYLIFVFPELLLVILALILVLGRYTGYRLLELTRFRAFAEGA